MTGVIDLSCTAEEIIGGFSSTYRYEVKRAKRDGVYCTYTDNPSEEELGSFISWYDEFARSKGLPDIDKGNIRLLAEIGNLGLSSAYDKEGILLCRHSYLMDRKIKRAALHTSASLAHTISDSRQRNLIGMANRYLHYFDMLWQKENGFLKYDFGGLDWTGLTDSEHQGISNFKKEFGCRREDSFESIIIQLAPFRNMSNERQRKERIVTFGSGGYFSEAWAYLSTLYDVAATSDNNADIWGHRIWDEIPVIKPDEIREYIPDRIVVTIMREQPRAMIVNQLTGMNLRCPIGIFAYGNNGPEIRWISGFS